MMWTEAQTANLFAQRYTTVLDSALSPITDVVTDIVSTVEQTLGLSTDPRDYQSVRDATGLILETRWFPQVTRFELIGGPHHGQMYNETQIIALGEGIMTQTMNMVPSKFPAEIYRHRYIKKSWDPDQRVWLYVCENEKGVLV